MGAGRPSLNPGMVVATVSVVDLLGRRGTPPPLPAEAVHLWQVPLTPAQAGLADLLTLLSEAERTRAQQFHFERHRQRFVAGRAALRLVLSRYTGVPAVAVPLAVGAFGKPALAEPAAGLHFNLTHAEDLALLAVTTGRELGVDLERVRPLPDLEAVAEHFFSTAERAEVLAQPPAQRPPVFFTCWTRKEAYLKAIGTGLAEPLQHFDVTPLTGPPPEPLWVQPHHTPDRRWRVADLPAPAGYAAALAAEGAAWSVTMWHQLSL